MWMCLEKSDDKRKNKNYFISVITEQFSMAHTRHASFILCCLLKVFKGENLYNVPKCKTNTQTNKKNLNYFAKLSLKQEMLKTIQVQLIHYIDVYLFFCFENHLMIHLLKHRYHF